MATVSFPILSILSIASHYFLVFFWFQRGIVGCRFLLFGIEYFWLLLFLYFFVGLSLNKSGFVVFLDVRLKVEFIVFLSKVHRLIGIIECFFPIPHDDFFFLLLLNSHFQFGKDHFQDLFVGRFNFLLFFFIKVFLHFQPSFRFIGVQFSIYFRF